MRKIFIRPDVNIPVFTVVLGLTWYKFHTHLHVGKRTVRQKILFRDGTPSLTLHGPVFVSHLVWTVGFIGFIGMGTLSYLSSNDGSPRYHPIRS